MRLEKKAEYIGSLVIAVLAFALGGAGAPGVAQSTQESGGEVVSARPFAVGERLNYSVRVGPLGRGSATAEITKVDTVRGKAVYHSVFRMNGSLLFFKVDDEYESWFDP